MIILLLGLVVSAMACMIIKDLLKASIALAAVSGLLTIIMFLMDAHLAAVFELSVCMGLITVILISAISMTRIHTKEEKEKAARARRKRFVLLPVLLIAVLVVALVIVWPHVSELLPHTPPPEAATEPEVFWNKRHADLLGQIVIILAGVLGVLIFFKERGKE